MLSDVADAEVDDAGGCVQVPGVGVPLVDGGGKTAIGARQTLDSGNGLRRCDRWGKPRIVATGRRRPADLSGIVEGEHRVVEDPATIAIE